MVGAPLEQYFDGVKVREFQGRVSNNGGVLNLLAFTGDEVTMEFKRKGSNEVVYRQVFNRKDAEKKVPPFYFDGTMHEKYTYPEVQGKDFQANFFVDVPADSAAADIMVEVIEFYFDFNLPNPQVIAGITSIPLATNVRAAWTPYITLSKLPPITPHHPDSQFWPIVSVKRAGTNEYYVRNNMTASSFQMQLPEDWSTQGLIQSMHVSFSATSGTVANDLVSIFPR